MHDFETVSFCVLVSWYGCCSFNFFVAMQHSGRSNSLIIYTVMDIVFVLVLITINVYVSALGLAHLGVTYGLGVCHACQDYVQTYCIEAASFSFQLCL